MTIHLAEEDVTDLHIAEVAFFAYDNPTTAAAIDKLLDDPVAIERIAEHHSSLLVRKMAARLRDRA